MNLPRPPQSDHESAQRELVLSRAGPPDLPADVSLKPEAVRGTDQTELAALLTGIRVRSTSPANAAMAKIMLSYGHRLAARITEAVNHGELSLSQQLVSACPGACKELEQRREGDLMELRESRARVSPTEYALLCVIVFACGATGLWYWWG